VRILVTIKTVARFFFAVKGAIEMTVKEYINLRKYITLSKAANLSPGRPHAATAWRWATHGVRGIKLRSIRSGNRVLTTQEWLDEFHRQCNQTNAERAAAELAADGC
jgi:hypothetical protein